MNIALLIPTLGGGGAERVASSVGDYLIDQGNHVYFFIGGHRLQHRYKVKGVIVNTGIVSSATGIYSEAVEMMKSARIMKKYKKQYHIDVAISFMEEFNFLNILSKGKEKVIIRVCTILSKRDDLEKSIVYNKYLLREIYNRANAIIVMTNYAKKELTDVYKITQKKIVVIPNPVSNLQNSSKEEWIFGDKCIACVGRLDDVKQHNVAIRAFKYIHKNFPNAQLLLLGEGGNKRRIKRLVEELGLQGNVQILGFKSNIGYYLEHVRVCMVTSKVEGFHIAMLEAMSKGVPIVSINCPGGPSEILGGNVVNNTQTMMCPYGILTPYINNNSWNGNLFFKEEQELAKSIDRFFQDNQLFKKYSEASLKRAQMYNFERIAAIWMKLIKNVTT